MVSPREWPVLREKFRVFAEMAYRLHFYEGELDKMARSIEEMRPAPKTKEAGKNEGNDG